MWRTFFVAIGLFLIILGAECLVVERAVLASDSAPSLDLAYTDNLAAAAPVPRVFEPPEWAPWSLLSSGAVVLLYAMSLRSAPSDG